MSVADLTGTTWLINSSPTPVDPTLTTSINFTSNNDPYTGLTLYDEMDAGGSIAYRNPDTLDFPVIVYDGYAWSSEAYRTISISGGTDATNSTLISWFEANATQVIQSHDVTISYNNSTIAYLDASGTEVLETDGTICADDITVEYTKPTPSLQAKTNISPTTSSQTITADGGYDGLSSVQINAISPTKSAQTYTPTTSNQTIASGQWLSGAQTIAGDANLLAENIKKDISIFGVTGTYEGSGGGGTALDILIRCNSTSDGWSTSTADYAILSGTISDIFVKSQNKELIEGRLIHYQHTYDDEEDFSSDGSLTAILTGIDYSYEGSSFPGWGQMTLFFFDGYTKKRIRIGVDDEQTILSISVQNF